MVAILGRVEGILINLAIPLLSPPPLSTQEGLCGGEKIREAIRKSIYNGGYMILHPFPFFSEKATLEEVLRGGRGGEGKGTG